ncbi:MAG TPA: DUF6456 domain-containing protein [Rhizomicrobium sp.]|nr:DUF6456 domain-containing protein [Rhizomicrobium sp.]
MTALGEGEVQREARRIFRKLDDPGAHLRRIEGGAFRIVCHGEREQSRSATASQAVVDAFVTLGWLSAVGSERYVLSEAGAGWYRRLMAVENPFLEQHQLRNQRLVTDANGVEQLVTINEAESPLSRMRKRKQIDAAQFEAGEKLRRDFTLAQLMPRLGVDLTAPVVLGRRGKTAERMLSETVIAAKQRFARAMRAAGPGLSDLLFDICCHLRGLEEAERAKGWPHRSARVVLAIALDRLVEHYGLRVPGTAGMRGWVAECE